MSNSSRTCTTCKGRILSHSVFIKCSVCTSVYHRNCLPFVDHDDFDHLKSNTHWMCCFCSGSIFPFNHFDENTDFINALSDNWFINDMYSLEDLNQRLFSPFEIDEAQNDILNHDHDPDFNFFHDLNVTSGSSVYCSEEKFRSLINTQNINSDTSLSFLHLNIRSVPKNLDKLQVYLHSLDFSFSFIGLSETWFNDTTRALYDLETYNQEAVFRSDRRGGGVSLFIRNTIRYSQRNDLNMFSADAETVFIEVDKSVFKTEKNIVIGLIYRIPNRDAKQFNDSLSNVLNLIKNENKLCYLLGDYNLNLLNSDTHSITNDFLDICFSHNFLPLINKPTRVTKHSATLIDHILTNNISNTSFTQGLFLTDISDHFPIFLIDKNTKLENTLIADKKRIINSKNIDKFNNMLGSHNFNNILDIHDVNSAMTLFHSDFSIMYEKCFPIKTVRRKYSCNKPWLSEGLKQSINRKHILYKRFIKNPSEQAEKEYKLYRNKVNHLLRVAERDHYHELITTNKDNLKKTWSIMKHIINKKKQSVNPDYFMHNSSKITNKKEIASHFNDFFVNIGSSLANKIPQSNKSPLSYLTDNYPNSFFLTPVNKNELILILKQLKTNSSSGWDDISPKILQTSHPFILDPLLHLINLSLNQGIFPDVMKIAKVLPLYKGNEKFLFTNYRPISILNSFSKIFERIFYNRLYNFLKKYDILYDKQFGFRSKYSTDMALIVLMDRISYAIEQGEFVLGVFLDFSKAFDTVNHDILLTKLDYYGIRGVANDWIRSYLCNRPQYVKYGEEKSSSKQIICGVPQGSILGPLLFLIYINDLSKISELLFMVMYADDTNIFLSGKNLKDLETTMNKELSSLTEWLAANKLSLNISKTHYMIFSPPRIKQSFEMNIQINSTKIHAVSQTKFLGVILDSQLSWKPHIKYISTKLSKNIGILGKARRYLNTKSLECLYYAFLYPYFLYCINIWGGANISTLKPLVTIQNWAVRTVSCKPRRTSSLPLYLSLKILDISQIYKLQVLTFVYKYKCLLLPSIFKDFFRCTSDVHNYVTRQQFNYYPPKCRTDISKRFIKYSGVVFWNGLSESCKLFIGSVAAFKKYIIRSWFS